MSDNEVCSRCEEQFCEPVIKNCANGHTFCFDCLCKEAKAASSYDDLSFTCSICKTGDGCIISLGADSDMVKKQRRLHSLRCLRDSYESMKKDMKWDKNFTIVIKPEVVVVYAKNATIFRVLDRCESKDERDEVLQSHKFTYPEWIKKGTEIYEEKEEEELVEEKDITDVIEKIDDFVKEDPVSTLYHGSNNNVEFKVLDEGEEMKYSEEYEKMLNGKLEP